MRAQVFQRLMSYLCVSERAYSEYVEEKLWNGREL